MKAVDSQETTAARTCVLSACMMFMCYVVPFGGVLTKALGGAALFTALFLSSPDRFRTRRGSLAVAYGLIALGWFSAAVVVVLSLSGALSDE